MLSTLLKMINVTVPMILSAIKEDAESKVNGSKEKHGYSQQSECRIKVECPAVPIQLTVSVEQRDHRSETRFKTQQL